MDVYETVVENNEWWTNGNSLALFDAIRKFAREQDNSFSGETHARLNSHLIGMARVVGLPEDDIREAFASERSLVIYEP